MQMFPFIKKGHYVKEHELVLKDLKYDIFPDQQNKWLKRTQRKPLKWFLSMMFHCHQNTIKQLQHVTKIKQYFCFVYVVVRYGIHVHKFR